MKHSYMPLEEFKRLSTGRAVLYLIRLWWLNILDIFTGILIFIAQTTTLLSIPFVIPIGNLVRKIKTSTWFLIAKTKNVIAGMKMEGRNDDISNMLFELVQLINNEPKDSRKYKKFMSFIEKERVILEGNINE